MKLLLIEDSHDIRQALCQALACVYTVDVANCGVDGLDKAAHHDYAIIILDLGLPDMNGLEVCQQLRAQGIITPILILSGESKVMSKISLLDAGADDYLTKPFSLGELKVRLRALQRRSASQSRPINRLEIGEIIIDSDRHTVERDGKVIYLRRKEFALLECLVQRAGSVVTRDMLCNYAWRDSDDPWNNTVDVHIKYLRDKFDKPFEQPLIQTVHGVGYKLVTELQPQLAALTK